MSSKHHPQPGIWRRGPALGGGGTAGPPDENNPCGQWFDGDHLLLAVNVWTVDVGWTVEYFPVRIHCDESMLTIEGMGDTEDTGWGIRNVSWWMLLPPLPEEGAE